MRSSWDQCALCDAESAHDVEQAGVIVGLFDDGADGALPGVRAREHLFELPLELVEAALVRAQQLQVVQRVGVHHLHQVADDHVGFGGEPDGIYHAGRIVEHAQQLVKP